MRMTKSSQPAKDFAIVDQESVCNAAETPCGLLIIDGDGLFADVAAGHNQGLSNFPRMKADDERRVRKK